MTGMQNAILWWRQLYTELGLSGVATTTGKLGEVAKHRHGTLLQLFFDLVRELNVDRFFEIGAHEAGASKHFIWMTPNGRAYAYEPAPAVFQKTVQSGIPDRMEIHNCAIGAQNGSIKFFQPVDERLHPMGSTRKRIGRVDGKEMEVEEVTAPVITLDEAARRASPSEDKHTALWIDVEGQALEVLNSGRNLISQHAAAIYIEVQDFNTYEGSATSLEVLELLLSLGFIPIARDNQHADAWNLLVLHEAAYLRTRETIAYWHRANSGTTTVSNMLVGGVIGTPTL